MTIDEVRTDVDHILLVPIFDDVGFGEDDLSLHPTGRADVEIVGPMAVISPLVFAEAVHRHLVADVLGDAGI